MMLIKTMVLIKTMMLIKTMKLIKTLVDSKTSMLIKMINFESSLQTVGAQLWKPSWNMINGQNVDYDENYD